MVGVDHGDGEGQSVAEMVEQPAKGDADRHDDQAVALEEVRARSSR